MEHGGGVDEGEGEGGGGGVEGDSVLYFFGWGGYRSASFL